MIPYNFDYYRPSSVREAVDLFYKLDRQGKRPLYLSGGTEIITLGRINQVYTEAVIDLKLIPECRTLVQDKNLVLGSALTLSEIHDARVFPLLGETGAGIADRTSRNKITFGGNICGQFIYKEAVLPLLLTDSEIVIAGPAAATRRLPIGQIFNRTLQLGRGEFLVQSITDPQYRTMPYVTIKKRKVAAIDYPVVTIAALKTSSGIRFAFSGLCSFPFRSAALERILNDRKLPIGERIQQAAGQLPAPILSDIKASAAYRELVWKNTLIDILPVLAE